MMNLSYPFELLFETLKAPNPTSLKQYENENLHTISQFLKLKFEGEWRSEQTLVWL